MRQVRFPPVGFELPAFGLQEPGLALFLAFFDFQIFFFLRPFFMQRLSGDGWGWIGLCGLRIVADCGLLRIADCDGLRIAADCLFLRIAGLRIGDMGRGNL